MPMTFVVTRTDMLRSKVLDPAWYKVKVTKVSQEEANTDSSMNTWIDFVVLSGPAQKDGSQPVDVPLRRCFNEKAPGFIVPFLSACGTKVGENGGNFDIERSVGREMFVYVKNRLWENNLQNDVADYRSVESFTASAKQ